MNTESEVAHLIISLDEARAHARAIEAERDQRKQHYKVEQDSTSRLIISRDEARAALDTANDQLRNMRYGEEVARVEQERDLWQSRARCAVWDASAAPDGWKSMQQSHVWVHDGRSLVARLTMSSFTEAPKWVVVTAANVAIGAPSEWAYDAMKGAQ